MGRRETVSRRRECCLSKLISNGESEACNENPCALVSIKQLSHQAQYLCFYIERSEICRVRVLSSSAVLRQVNYVAEPVSSCKIGKLVYTSHALYEN